MSRWTHVLRPYLGPLQSLGSRPCLPCGFQISTETMGVRVLWNVWMRHDPRYDSYNIYPEKIRSDGPIKGLLLGPQVSSHH